MRKTSLFHTLLLCCVAASYQAHSAIPLPNETNWTAATDGHIYYNSNWNPYGRPGNLDTGVFQGPPGASVDSYEFYHPFLFLGQLYTGEFLFEGPGTFNTYVVGSRLHFETNGITNTSLANQKLFMLPGGELNFHNTSSADSTESGNVFIYAGAGSIHTSFHDSSTASNANFNIYSSFLNFYDTSTADNAYIYLNDASVYFKDSSSLGSANIIATNGSYINEYNSNPDSLPAIDLRSNSILILFNKYSYYNTGGAFQVSKLNGDASTHIVSTSGPLLIVNNTEDCTFAGTFNSRLGIEKRGPAKFTISGQTAGGSTYLVEEGTLNFASANPINGQLIVRDKGTLSGNIQGPSSLAFVYSGGTISPGNSIGTMEFGIFALGSNGKYACEVDKSGDSDLIIADTLAFLDGTLAVSDIDGRLLFHKYKILTSSNPINGTFELVTDTNPLVLDVVDYSDPLNVFLSFLPNLRPAACTRNEINIANRLDGITNPTTEQIAALDALVNQSVSDAGKSLNQFSGEQYTFLLQLERYGNERLNRRVYNAVRNTLSPCWYADPCHQLQTWFQIEEGQSYAHENGHCDGLRSLNWDFSLGAFAPLCDGFLVGAAINYQVDRVHFYRGGHTNWETVQGAIYGSYKNDYGYLFADFIYGGSRGHFKRSMNFNGFEDHAKSTPEAEQGLIYAEIGIDLCLCDMLFQPFFAGEFGFYEQRKFHESNSDLGLFVDKKSKNTTDTYLGTHLTTYWNCFTISADIAWQHRFDNSANDIQTGFNDFGSGFETQGVRLGNDAVKFAFDISSDVSECVTLYAEFSGERWKNWGGYGIDLGIGVWW